MIRILDLCHTNAYAVGQKVVITPANCPLFDTIHANYTYISPNTIREDKKQEPLAYRYDRTVLRTAWGTIELID